MDTYNSSTRVTALLLPGYSPDLAWMARALNAGTVILDDLHPFSRKSKVHRTKIRTPDGHQWLTIPFLQDDRRKPIREVRIDDRRPWLRHHLQALEFNYRNSLYFDFYEPEIRADFTKAAESGFLLDTVRHLMQRQWLYLELSTFPHWASDLVCKSHPAESADMQPSSSQTLYDIIADERTVVWQEPDSRHFQKPHPRAQEPVPASRTSTESSRQCSGPHPCSGVRNVSPSSAGPDQTGHPVYRQHFPGFVPGCGVLDLLFEYGPDAWQVLDRIVIERTT